MNIKKSYHKVALYISLYVSIYKIISYVIILAVFLSMSFYLDSPMIIALIFSTILIAMLHSSSIILRNINLNKNNVLYFKIIMYIQVVILVFAYAAYCGYREDVIKIFMSTVIGSGSVIGYLIAISHSGRKRNEI